MEKQRRTEIQWKGARQYERGKGKAEGKEVGL